MTDIDQQLPAVGSEIMLAVAQAPMRTTIFPEQALVAKPGPEVVEFVFLRNELVMPIQQGRVRSVSDGHMDVEIVHAPITTQLTDIGHVRLTKEVAIKLWIATAEHLMQHHSVARDELQGALTNANGGSTS